jgi:hypothetical protein
VKNNLPISWVVAFSLVGMKCAILLNQSTTTMIASNPLDGGPSGIDNGHNNLACFLFNFIGKSSKCSHIPPHPLSN